MDSHIDMGKYNMKTFLEWFINESTDVYGDPDYRPIYTRQIYNQKVQAGLQGEAELLGQLSKLGMKVDSSNPYEDKSLGIDGYVTMDGKRYSVQLKRKFTNNDIALELSMDRAANDPNSMPNPLNFLNNLNGKDAKSRADLYVVRSMDRSQVRVLSTQEVKRLVLQAVQQWREVLSDPMLKKYPTMAKKYMNDFFYGGSGGNHSVKLKLFWDREKSVWKMIGYITPDAIKPIKVLQVRPVDASSSHG